MANIIIFDVEAKRVIDYLKSVHTPDFAGRDDVIINPEDLPACIIKYWKVVKKKVVEMSQAEKDVVDAEEKEKEKQARLDTAQSGATSLQTDIQYLIDNFTQQQIIDLAKDGDLTARILVLKVLYTQADTATKKLKVLAKFNRLLSWEV